MKIEIPQIFWHGNRDRIMSIDFYPNTNLLMTCGAESEDKMWIKLWDIEELEKNNQNFNSKNINNINNQNLNTHNFQGNINNIQCNTIDGINFNQDRNENSSFNPFKTDKLNPLLNANNNYKNINNPTIVETENNDENINNIIPIEENINLNNTNLLPQKDHNNPINNSAAIPAYIYIKPKFLYELNGAHTSTVNIIRFSPNGQYLASGGDDSAIVIWVQKSRPIEFGSNIEKVVWSNFKILRGHLSDIYDIAWSPDSKYLISGSVDNRALIWSLEKGKVIDRSIDHTHFVQGVSWDPKNQYVTTQSTDKSAKILCNANVKTEIKFYPNFVLKKYSKSNYAMLMHNLANDINEENNPNDNNMMEIDCEDKGEKNNSNLSSNLSGNNGISGTNNNNNINFKNKLTKISNGNAITSKKDKNNPNNNIHYFADEIQCNSFVRRHGWSPDGSILLMVSGLQKDDNGNLEFVVWGFSREDLSKPSFYLPTLDKSPVCLRFCPIIFKKDDDSNSSEPELIDLPYKMVFAVGTIDSLFIYDTQSISPRFAITNIHFQSLTDIAWNGCNMLAASSADGYISFFIFEKNELGIPENPVNLPEDLKNSYENYINIDVNKTIYQGQNVTTVIKSKKKKEDFINNNIGINIEYKKNNDNNESFIANEVQTQVNLNLENTVVIEENNDKKINSTFDKNNNTETLIDGLNKKYNSEQSEIKDPEFEVKMTIDDQNYTNISNLKSNMTTDGDGKKKKRIQPTIITN